MLSEAAQIAFEQKDTAALSYVLAYCGTSDRRIAEKINGMIATLTANK